MSSNVIVVAIVDCFFAMTGDSVGLMAFSLRLDCDLAASVGSARSAVDGMFPLELDRCRC